MIPGLNLYQYQDIVNKDRDSKKTRNHSANKTLPYLQNSNKIQIKKLKLNKIAENPMIYTKTENNSEERRNLPYYIKLNNSVDNINLKKKKEEDIDLLMGKDKEKLMRYDPIRRNIEMIKNIESYKKQGIVFPGIRKERKLLEPPLKYCYKFREDPQKFYGEKLCDSMYEALDFKIIKNK